MKILFVNSGIPGFSYRYAYDIHQTLSKDLNCTVYHLAPQLLSKKRIREYRPDLILVIHGTFTPPTLIRYAGERGIKTVLWLVEDPYEIDDHHRIIEAYDYVFTNEQQAVKEYNTLSAAARGHGLEQAGEAQARAGGISEGTCKGPSKVTYLPWCCNPHLHKPFSVGPQYQSDLCFVGMGFPNRLQIVNALAPLLKKLHVKLIGDWQTWGSLHPELKDKVYPVVDDFFEIIKYYNGAKINLNIHRDPCDPPSGNRRMIGATSPNDRLFALAGCGAFQLVDDTRPDLYDCFRVGEELITFHSPEDLGEKIVEYLKNETLRQAIGQAAWKRAYKEHTYKQRLTRIFQLAGMERERKKPVYTGINFSGVSSSPVFSSEQSVDLKFRY